MRSRPGKDCGRQAGTLAIIRSEPAFGSAVIRLVMPWASMVIAPGDLRGLRLGSDRRAAPGPCTWWHGITRRPCCARTTETCYFRPKPGLLLNIDVPDLAQGVRFYTEALGLKVGRWFDSTFVELVGADAPIYLLEKQAGTSIGPPGGDIRSFERHWSPIHPDFVVADLDASVLRAVAAGAVQEGRTCDAPYGRLAMFADPFGHGFCLIEFNSAGYDALLPQ